MRIVHQLSAEQIAYGLEMPRQLARGQYQACCPAHTDKSPSLSITEKAGKVLLYCFSGCTQTEVIEALVSRGLWPKKSKKAKVHTLVDRLEMESFCAAHVYNLRKQIPTSTKHQRLYRQYQRVLCSPFTPGELIEMNLFCMLYQADTRKGKTSTPDDDEKFLAFSRVVYDKGVPYDC
tara:strand:- start:2186 stop:2716 length:531 start_codon:yes stop_codon:yes gene_type:complete